MRAVSSMPAPVRAASSPHRPCLGTILPGEAPARRADAAPRSTERRIVPQIRSPCGILHPAARGHSGRRREKISNWAAGGTGRGADGQMAPPDTAHRTWLPGGSRAAEEMSCRICSSIAGPPEKIIRIQGSLCCHSMSLKEVKSGSHCSSMVRVSPWRFLATMHSARLGFSVSLL